MDSSSLLTGYQVVRHPQIQLYNLQRILDVLAAVMAKVAVQHPKHQNLKFFIEESFSVGFKNKL